MYGCGDSPSVRHLIFKPYQVREKKPNHSCIFNPQSQMAEGQKWSQSEESDHMQRYASPLVFQV